MSISFRKLTEMSSQNVYIFYDKETSLRAILAIHSTALGPAIGGCRMIPYKNEDEALRDVSQLAKNMTYKCALAGIRYGGGKSVILPPELSYNRKQLFNAFGKFVNKLGGDYITAIDSGTTMDDMKIVATATPYVTGYTGQTDCYFNPSYYTAKGVMESLLASVEFKYGCNDLSNLKIFIKGVGSVGSFLAKFLKEKHAKVYITDIDVHKVKACSQETGAIPAIEKDIHTLDLDILCPCDVEHTISEDNIRDISVSIIVGATNNQLETDSLARDLFKKGILYCPDYIANAGGLIYVTDLYEHNNLETIDQKINNIYPTTLEIFRLSEKSNKSTKEIADLLAETKIKNAHLEKV